jgi:hypothetical protein
MGFCLKFFQKFSSKNQSFFPLVRRASNKKLKNMRQICLRITEEAFNRFTKLHKKTGLKNQGQTFEVLVFREAEEEDFNTKRLKSMEEKLDYIVEWTNEPL